MLFLKKISEYTIALSLTCQWFNFPEFLDIYLAKKKITRTHFHCQYLLIWMCWRCLRLIKNSKRLLQSMAKKVKDRRWDFMAQTELPERANISISIFTRKKIVLPHQCIWRRSDGKYARAQRGKDILPRKEKWNVWRRQMGKEGEIDFLVWMLDLAH